MKVSLRWIWENLWRKFPEYRDKISDVIGDETACVERIALYSGEKEGLSGDCLWFGVAEELFRDKREDFEKQKFFLWGKKNS